MIGLFARSSSPPNDLRIGNVYSRVLENKVLWVKGFQYNVGFIEGLGFRVYGVAYVLSNGKSSKRTRNSNTSNFNV